MTRIVLDTNVLISAILNPHGSPGIILDRVFPPDIRASVQVATCFRTFEGVQYYARIQAFLSKRKKKKNVKKLYTSLHHKK